MRLAREDDLDGTARVGQETPQPFRIMEEQVGALVGREAPGETDREHGRGKERARCSQFRRIVPFVVPAVPGFLTDVVKEQMAEAVVDRPQPVIISRAYGGGDGAEVHAIRHMVDGHVRGGLVAPHPSPDPARFFAVSSRHGVHAAPKP